MDWDANRVAQYVSKEYWGGAHCLDLRVPWFTPDAVRFFEYKRILKFLEGARVLELGSGGSTLFFADYCKSVVSLETNRDWIQKVRAVAPKNAELIHVEGMYILREVLRDVSKNRFDIAIIDGDPAAYGRGEAADLVLPMMKPSAIFITDNYYLQGSMVKEFQCPSDWDHNDFNDKHWHGCGTRISTRGL